MYWLEKKSDIVRILIIGAGVLGSNLAHSMRKGNDITIHAMSAREEFMMLESEFEKLKNGTGIETEAYDKLKVDFLHYRERLC